MIVLLVIGWLCIGFVSNVLIIRLHYKEVLVRDLFEWDSFISYLFGPMAFLIWILIVLDMTLGGKIRKWYNGCKDKKIL